MSSMTFKCSRFGSFCSVFEVPSIMSLWLKLKRSPVKKLTTIWSSEVSKRLSPAGDQDKL